MALRGVPDPDPDPALSTRGRRTPGFQRTRRRPSDGGGGVCGAPALPPPPPCTRPQEEPLHPGRAELGSPPDGLEVRAGPRGWGWVVRRALALAAAVRSTCPLCSPERTTDPDRISAGRDERGPATRSSLLGEEGAVQSRPPSPPTIPAPGRRSAVPRAAARGQHFPAPAQRAPRCGRGAGLPVSRSPEVWGAAAPRRARSAVRTAGTAVRPAGTAVRSAGSTGRGPGAAGGAKPGPLPRRGGGGS